MEYQIVILLLVYLAMESAGQLLQVLNLKYLSRHGAEVPPGFEDYVDVTTLAKMRDYSVEHGRIDILEAFAFLVVTIIFLFGGLLNWYNNLIAAQGWSPIISGVIFFVLLIYGDTLLNVPFSLYKTFSLEKRYGFTNQTLSLWAMDLVKSLFVTSLLMGFLFSVLLKLIQLLPHLWWLAGWGFVLIFTVFLLYIAPYVIEPLFNKFSPVEDVSLEESIKETMSRAGLKINRVFAMDASRRSSHSNAYFTGIGHVKRIVLFDTMLANHTDEEIVAILAHEAGHWKKKHVLKMLLVSQAIGLVGFYFAHKLTVGDQLAELFSLDMPSMHAKLLLVAFIGMLVLFPLKPFMAYLSRLHEIEADNFAVDLTADPRSLAKALIKLGRDNLANLHPHPLYAAVYYSHPPQALRVQGILSQHGIGAVS